jgi:hypothetical protein
MKKLILLLVAMLLLAGCAPSPSTAVPKASEEATAAVKAIDNYFADRIGPVVIYEQIPFENGSMLLLAEHQTDGEIYPNLFMVDKDGSISALTRHSYCWSMNFTQIDGYTIFFGLAGIEALKAEKAIQQVEAVYSDKTEAAATTRHDIVARLEGGEDYFRDVEDLGAYILPVRRQDMPDTIYGVFSDGKKVSIPRMLIDWYQDMPDYFNAGKNSIYNSFAFTYCPMLSPERWKQADVAGDIGLYGQTDENGNLAALFLRPSQTVVKATQAAEFPQDIKAFGLSNNEPWTGGFSAAVKAEVVHEGKELYDCRVFRLTRESVRQETWEQDFQKLQPDDKNRITLPKEAGHYLFLLRIRENDGLHAYMNVFEIQ